MSKQLNLFENEDSTEVEQENLSLNEIADKLIKERNRILDDFAKAYIAEQKIMPSELELVISEEKQGNTVETIYYFRKRNIENESGK